MTTINTNCIPDNWNPDCPNAFNKWLNKIFTERASKFNVEYETVK